MYFIIHKGLQFVTQTSSKGRKHKKVQKGKQGIGNIQYREVLFSMGWRGLTMGSEVIVE
jgi:hypothetical protein